MEHLQLSASKHNQATNSHVITFLSACKNHRGNELHQIFKLFDQQNFFVRHMFLFLCISIFSRCCYCWLLFLVLCYIDILAIHREQYFRTVSTKNSIRGSFSCLNKVIVKKVLKQVLVKN